MVREGMDFLIDKLFGDFCFFNRGFVIESKVLIVKVQILILLIVVYVFWNFCIVVEIFESKGGVKKYKSSKVLVFVVNIRGFEDNMLLRVFEIDG